jgi:hypothetical protein
MSLAFSLIFYDAHGRSGISAKAFDHGKCRHSSRGGSVAMLTSVSEVFDILRGAERAVDTCACENGCSKCMPTSRQVMTKGLTRFKVFKVVSARRTIKSRPNLAHTLFCEVFSVLILTRMVFRSRMSGWAHSKQSWRQLTYDPSTERK